MYIAKENDLIVKAAETIEEIENSGINYTTIEETDVNYIYYRNGQYLTPEEVEQKEKERVGELQVTKRVFALALQQLGVTYSQLKALIATSDQAQLEWDLCVELQRKNPLLDVMAEQMSIGPQMLDYIFQKANGENVEPPASEV